MCIHIYKYIMCKHAAVYKSMSSPRTAAKLAVDMLSLQIKTKTWSEGQAGF